MSDDLGKGEQRSRCSENDEHASQSADDSTGHFVWMNRVVVETNGTVPLAHYFSLSLSLRRSAVGSVAKPTVSWPSSHLGLSAYLVYDGPDHSLLQGPFRPAPPRSLEPRFPSFRVRE